MIVTGMAHFQNRNCTKTCTRKYRIHATRRNKKDESNAITANGWQN